MRVRDWIMCSLEPLFRVWVQVWGLGSCAPLNSCLSPAADAQTSSPNLLPPLSCLAPAADDKPAQNLVVSVIRNCNSHTGRKDYLEELGEHIKVDHYGACLRNRPAPEDPKMWMRMYGEAKMRLLASYRFCVALENSVQVHLGFRV